MVLLYLVAALLGSCAEGTQVPGSQSLSQRYLDPVVITGAEVPSLLGCADCVDNLVAFSWTDGAWSQAPLQVDERHIQDYYNIKNGDCLLYDRNMTGLVYADPGTYSGADDDDTLDMDDEIVFMARFLGEKSEGMSSPEGVVEGMMEELEVLDPVTDTSLGFMYLFLSDGSLDQAAGNPLVEYVFNLTTTDESGSNAYFDVYHNEQISQDAESKNPENSYFKSKNYQRHFAENWNSDNLKIFSGESTGESLGAHQEFQFFQDSCGRCTYSFLRGATGFIVNKAGPVRAIRSWVGANSGTFTQRDSVMYEQREDVTTYLRVHTIPSIMDYISYKEDLPLIYYNCHNEEGIEVDGSPDDDSFNNKFCHWEFVTGRAGSLLRTYQIDTDLVPAGNPDAALEAWFYDNKTPDRVEEGVAIYPNNFHQCSTKLTSQKAAWGTHGMKLKSNIDHIPNTDPNRIIPIDDETYPGGCSRPKRESSLNHLTITNNIYYLNPGLEIKDAKKIYQGAATPLIIRTNNFEK